jgi:hypothetical protein
LGDDVINSFVSVYEVAVFDCKFLAGLAEARGKYNAALIG